MVVLASVISAWTSRRLFELQEDALLPNLHFTIDSQSRYSLAQLKLTNKGPSAAYNLGVTWTEPPMNHKGQPVEFGTNNRIAVLGPGDSASVLLGEVHDFFNKYAGSVYSGKINFHTAAGQAVERTFLVSPEFDQQGLDHQDEIARTGYELQKLPEALAQIAREIRMTGTSRANQSVEPKPKSMRDDPPTSDRPEDAPRTLIFVDLLGFAELTRRNPTRILEWGPDHKGWTHSRTTELQTRVQRFQQLLDRILSEQNALGELSGEIFSDCAYVDAGTTARAAMVAVDLMQAAIRVEVPVRMGLGRGTFYAFKHSVETSGVQVISKALFAGTAVINSHDAERCGAKGCRILVHPSVETDLNETRSSEVLVPLPAETKAAKSEMCYLPYDREKFELDSRFNRRRSVDQDLLFVRHVNQMLQNSEPVDDHVRLHYTETLAAIDRMRKVLGRGTTIEEAEAIEQQQIDEEDAIADSTAGG